MKNYFKTLVMMFKAVYGYCLDPAQIAITHLVQAFIDGINALKNKTAAIDALVLVQSTNITGYAAHKKALKEGVVKMVYAIIKPTAAFAKATKNEILLAQVKLSLSVLRKTDDSIFGQKMTDLIDAVNEYILSLAPYSVTPAMIAAAQSGIDAYNLFMAVPRNKVGERKAITLAIETLVTDTNDLVRFQLDPLAVAFRKNNPDYYNSYLAMRKHVNYGNGTTKLRVIVMNDVNGNPVPLAVISISGTNLTATTDIDGKGHIDVVPKGIRTVTVVCAGYETKTTQFVDFVKGDYVDLTVTLVPAFNVPAPAPENIPSPANN